MADDTDPPRTTRYVTRDGAFAELINPAPIKRVPLSEAERMAAVARYCQARFAQDPAAWLRERLGWYR